jgi:hypothetical protein
MKNAHKENELANEIRKYKNICIKKLQNTPSVHSYIELQKEKSVSDIDLIENCIQFLVESDLKNTSTEEYNELLKLHKKLEQCLWALAMSAEHLTKIEAKKSSLLLERRRSYSGRIHWAFRGC